MAVELFNIVGIRTRDINMPGSLYLSEEGDLTKDIKRAKLVPTPKLEQAVKEVKAFSPNFFCMEVTT